MSGKSEKDKELQEKLNKLMALSKDIVGLTGVIAKDLADKARTEATKTLQEVMTGIKKTLDVLSAGKKPGKPPA
jgi:ElaB/YqjD/DUF883 family membrane-anchored ribosome-binding protein